MTQVEKDALIAAIAAQRAATLAYLLPRNRIVCDQLTDALDAILVLVEAIVVTP